MLGILDVPQPQVRVEAKVVELSWDDQLRLGMAAKVNRPLGDTFLQTAAADFQNSFDNNVGGFAAAFRSVDKYLIFDYAYQAAQQGARADVEARPSIVTCQGETATIEAGDREPFVVQTLNGNTVSSTVQFEPTGVRLEVQPLLIGRDSVRVRIAARASRVSDFRVTATSATQEVVNAVISSRTADTVLTVPDGETVVIGGLNQKAKTDVRTGIPLLKDIPVLGYLFGSTTTRDQSNELFFWITLTIERPEEARLMVPPSELERSSGAPAGGTR
jgi:general secretion pathway protein D